MSIFVIEQLPSDIAFERNICHYIVREYEVVRESEQYIFVKRADGKNDREIKQYKQLFLRYGRYDRKCLALKKIELMLAEEYKKSLSNTRECVRQLRLFYRDNKDYYNE